MFQHAPSFLRMKSPTQREARLLCYFPNYESYPDYFKKRNISLFPIANGRYILLVGVRMFVELPENLNANEKHIETFKTVLDSVSESKSEQAHISTLAANGIINKYFDNAPYNFVYIGRQYSKKRVIKFANSCQVETGGVQYETDAIFESDTEILLFEIKTEPQNTINIRQLIYSYLENTARTIKKVTPVVMVIGPEGRYNFYIFEVSENPLNFMCVKRFQITIAK
ncbi:MAG: type II restriction enzyme [archaeon]